MKASASVRPRLARAFLSVILILFGVALAVSACVHQTNNASQASSPASGSASPSGATAQAPAHQAAPAPPRLPAPYLPLWPFANGQQVRGWEAGYRSGGHQPWHLSAQQTALSFTQGFLGYTEINRVAATTISGRDARVAVGFRTDAGRVGTAAVIHLVRYGTGDLAPWEVVGTDDTTLSLTTPEYGGHVAGRIAAGGRVTGVDESISLRVRQQSSGAPAGQFCCVPGGGQNQPWSATVSLRGGAHGVLTIAASTGGHLTAVERFAVTAVVR
jgi:hypothetical protein